MLWGSPVSSRPLQSISGFSYRYTSTLYIEFDDQDKIRLADVSNEKELENLQANAERIIKSGAAKQKETKHEQR